MIAINWFEDACWSKITTLN